MSADQLDLLLRVAFAGIAGTIIGAEREYRGHPAGLRTHALVAIGAAAFTAVGLTDWGTNSTTIDPTRIAAQVVSGIGFIGAGAILRSGSGVRGLTTATTIWVAGAMGVVFGTGTYTLAVGTTLLVLTVLVVFRWLAAAIARVGLISSTLAVEYEVGHGTIGPILRAIEQLDVNIDRLAVNDSPQPGQPGQPDVRSVRLDLTTRSDSTRRLFEQLSTNLEHLPEVRSVDFTIGIS